jgi:predicted HD superfamily hydrolase involved in NAD metabolism
MTIKSEKIFKIDEIKRYLEDNLSNELYLHCIRTAEYALGINRELNLGLDESKIELAGLLHDLAKEYPDKKYFDIAADFEYVFSDIELLNPSLLHAMISAIEAERLFGVEDTSILSAIITHTTGASGMSDFDLLIYVADKLEPGRDFPGIEDLRIAVFSDFHTGCLAVMEHNKRYVLERGKEFHPDTDIAIQELKEKLSSTDNETAQIESSGNGVASPDLKRQIAKTLVTLDRFIIICTLSATLLTVLFTVAFTALHFYNTWNRLKPDNYDGPGSSYKQKPYSSYFEGNKELLFLVCGLDDVQNSSRTDTIILTRMDFRQPKLNMLSIPRDSWVKISTKRGEHWGKINAALTEGEKEGFIKTIHSLTSFYPDYLIFINYTGFVKIVDLVGGVEIDVEENMKYDDYAGHLHINLKKGKQILNGDQALGFVRYRHYVDGDFSRMKNQQKFFKAFLKEFFKFKNVSKWQPIIVSVLENVDVTVINPDYIEPSGDENQPATAESSTDIQDNSANSTEENSNLPGEIPPDNNKLIIEDRISVNQYMVLANALYNIWQSDAIKSDTLKMRDESVTIRGQSVLLIDYDSFDESMTDFFEN